MMEYRYGEFKRREKILGLTREVSPFLVKVEKFEKIWK